MATITVCERCGKKFTPHFTMKNNQRFCSKQCRMASWVDANREKLNAKVRQYRAKRYKDEGRWRDEGPKAVDLKAYLVEVKSKPCQDCGGTFPTCCMDFDHREGEKKTGNVGSMFAHHYAKETIAAEIAKCDIVCANCHRIRTQQRRIGNGRYK